MFYKRFLKITDVFDEETVNEFDFWLCTLTERESKTIVISTVASRLDVNYSVAEGLVTYAYKQNILKKKYVIVCPKESCKLPYGAYDGDEVIDMLGKTLYCHNCEEEFIVNQDNIVVVFERIAKPDVPDEEISKAIWERLDFSDEDLSNSTNFSLADSLGKNVDAFYELFYSPDESAYQELHEMQKALDYDYGRNTTAQGEAYEKLALALFRLIKGIKGTNKIRTYTNQFDCTLISPIMTVFPSIFQFLTPMFIAECKNENITPSNTYFHKLISIMTDTEAKVGIVFSRKAPSKEDIEISHHKYLVTQQSKITRYMISMDDNDLEAIITHRVNLLSYLNYKIIELSINARNATYDMFLASKS